MTILVEIDTEFEASIEIELQGCLALSLIRFAFLLFQWLGLVKLIQLNKITINLSLNKELAFAHLLLKGFDMSLILSCCCRWLQREQFLPIAVIRLFFNWWFDFLIIEIIFIWFKDVLLKVLLSSVLFKVLLNYIMCHYLSSLTMNCSDWLWLLGFHKNLFNHFDVLSLTLDKLDALKQ